MNQKSVKERAKILQLLVEGNSVRGTARIADCSINTVLRLLENIGAACLDYQDKVLINLPCKRIQIDELWAFVYAKNRNLEYGMEDYAGDIWTFTAIDPDTKLAPTWLVGGRNASAARQFIDDLASRMADKIQLSSDGYRPYRDAVDDTFGADVDYGVLYKLYKPRQDGMEQYQGFKKLALIGAPIQEDLTTAHVERQNLTMRTNIKRFARRTNAHSKKIENHCHAVALHFMYYNFARIHTTLRVTPAMAAGVTDRLWSLEDIVNLMPNAPASENTYQYANKTA